MPGPYWLALCVQHRKAALPCGAHDACAGSSGAMNLWLRVPSAVAITFLCSFDVTVRSKEADSVSAQHLACIWHTPRAQPLFLMESGSSLRKSLCPFSSSPLAS